MSDERLDLSALDPAADPERFERMVGNITWGAQQELQRRRRRVGPLEMMATWYRPAFVAAAAIAGVSLTLLATAQSGTSEVSTGAYMSAVEVPAAMSTWYEEDIPPTASDLLVVATEGGN